MPKFTFTPENLVKIQEHITHYPPGRQASAVIFLLSLAQHQNGGWIPQEAIETVAEILEMPPIRVQEVASFHSLFHLKPVEKCHVQICQTLSCWLRGSEALYEACKNEHVTLTTCECLGNCTNAPVVRINDATYNNLTPEKLIDILKQKEKAC